MTASPLITFTLEQITYSCSIYRPFNQPISRSVWMAEVEKPGEIIAVARKSARQTFLDRRELVHVNIYFEDRLQASLSEPARLGVPRDCQRCPISEIKPARYRICYLEKFNGRFFWEICEGCFSQFFKSISPRERRLDACHFFHSIIDLHDRGRQINPLTLEPMVIWFMPGLKGYLFSTS